VQVTCDLPPGFIARLDDPALSCARLALPRSGDVALALCSFGDALFLYVRKRDYRAAAARGVHRRRPVGHRERRSVAPEEPVLVAMDRFAGSSWREIGHPSTGKWDPSRRL